MKKTLPLLFALAISITFSCRKSTVLSEDNRLIDFQIDQQLQESSINNGTKQINIVLPYTADKTKLKYSFKIPEGAILTFNSGPRAGNTGIADFSNTTSLSVLAPNGNLSVWGVKVRHDVETYGLGTTLRDAKSIATTEYDWYKDQAQTGLFSSINCGPAVATMALHWADPSFTHTVEEARNTYRASGGWWYTTDIVNYLNKYQVNSSHATLTDRYQTIKKYIDKEYLVILCLDSYYITYNPDPYLRVDKYYKVAAKDTGHFIIVKGYRQVDDKFFFEVYDPWSYGSRYILGNQLKGKDRYYNSQDIEVATNVWWDFAILVAPKGKNISHSASNTKMVVPPAQKGM